MSKTFYVLHLVPILIVAENDEISEKLENRLTVLNDFFCLLIRMWRLSWNEEMSKYFFMRDVGSLLFV